MKRLRSTSAGRWWLVWVSGGREWVLGSSTAVNAACLAVFDPSTNSALSRQPECVKKFHMGVYDPPRLILSSLHSMVWSITCPVGDEGRARLPLGLGGGVAHELAGQRAGVRLPCHVPTGLAREGFTPGHPRKNSGSNA